MRVVVSLQNVLAVTQYVVNATEWCVRATNVGSEKRPHETLQISNVHFLYAVG